ncbi:MAG: hypothetical protein CSB49_05190, partial [Proteobacteria bacterium]
LGDADAFEARKLIWPDQLVDHVITYIQEADNWFWDDENGVYNALISLSPDQRFVVWERAHGDLAGLLSHDDLRKVRAMCVSDDGNQAATVDTALMMRMDLATTGMGTDEEGAHLTATLAGQHRMRAQQIDARLYEGVNTTGQPLTDEARAALLAEKAAMGDMDALFDDPQVDTDRYDGDSFLGMAQGDLSPDEFTAVQQAVHADPFQVAKQRILAAEHCYGNEWEVIFDALEAARAAVDGSLAECTEGPQELPAQQQRLLQDALLLRLREDEDLKPIFDALSGDEADRLHAIATGDPYGMAKGRILALLDDWSTDDAQLLRVLCDLSEDDRASLVQDRPLYERLLVHNVGNWREVVSAAIHTGRIPTDLALTYGIRGTVNGPNKDIVFDALSRLTDVERQQLCRGYVLDGMGRESTLPEDQDAIDAWRALHARLDDKLSAEDMDEALQRLVGLPTPAELLSASSRLERAEILLLRQRERMAMRNNLTAWVSNTDDTMEIAHAQFLAAYHAATEDGDVTLPELSELAALDQAFNACFVDHEQTSDTGADIAATVAAVAVGIGVAIITGGPGAASWPAIAAWVSANAGTMVSGAVIGGIASATAAERFGGDFRDADDAARQAVAGAVEVLATLTGAAMASSVLGMSGLSGASLRAAIVRSAAKGTAMGLRQVGRAVGAATLEGVIDGIVGGAMGDLVWTLTDPKTYQQSLWGVVCTAGQAVVRGGAIGGATGGLAATGVVAARGVLARRALRGIEVVEDTSLGRLSRIDYEAPQGGRLQRVIFRVGRQAKDSDIIAHLDAVMQMQRIDRLAARVAGTEGFEAVVEVDKLQRVLQDRLQELSGDRLPPGTLANFRAELDVLEYNLDHFAARMDSLAPGSSRIGQFDAPVGYPELPTGPDGERLYTYFRKPGGEWGVRRLEIDGETPALHIEVNEAGERCLKEGLVDEGPTPTFGDDTTSQMALELLTGPSSQSSLKPLYEMARREGLVDEAALLASLPAQVGGMTEDIVRRRLKGVLKERLIDAMFGGGQPFTAEESIAVMRRMLTTELNSGDLGSLSEEWYQAFARRYGDRPDLIRHPQLLRSSLDNPRSPDFVEGATLIEVKSTRAGLSTRDVDQLNDYLRTAQNGERVMVRGLGTREVNKVRIVFTNPEGAAGSLGDLEDFFEQFGDVLEVEVIGATGSSVYRDRDTLATALGAPR